MEMIVGASGRIFLPLPIDGNLGFPQTFPLVFAGRSYRFRLYVNVSAALLSGLRPILDLPSNEAFLVMHVELDGGSGILQPILIRKIVPGLEYEVDTIALTFQQQRVAVQNLNGQGNFGSQVKGGIALRWA